MLSEPALATEDRVTSREKVCAECGQPVSGRHKFCRPSCRELHRRGRQLPLLFEERRQGDSDLRMSFGSVAHSVARCRCDDRLHDAEDSQSFWREKTPKTPIFIGEN
jgi:hypothetical protein